MSATAWMAGLFEGEGTITITRSARGNKVYTRPHVILCMTDLEVITMFAERYPEGVLSTRQPTGNARLAHIWTLQSRVGILRFLDELEPEFRTERVRAKAKLLREDVAARVQGRRDPSGRYMEACHDRMAEMRHLNKRGVAA